MNAREKASELISIIKTNFLTHDGLLSRHYPPGRRLLHDNFDDLVPFFLFYGEADFLRQQIRTIRRLNLDPISISSQKGVLCSRNLDEWLGGLFALWEATHDSGTYELLKSLVDFITNTLMTEDFLSPTYLIQSGKTLAQFYEPWSSGLLESSSEMRRYFPEMFEKSVKVMDRWLHDEYFESYGLFPYRMYESSWTKFAQKHLLAYFPPLSRFSEYRKGIGRSPGTILKNIGRSVRFQLTNGWYSQLMKSNSTCAFTLIEFYRVTGEERWKRCLMKWLDAACACFAKDDAVYMEYFPKMQIRREPGVSPAFILIDVLCDAVKLASAAPKYLDVARRLLEYQWSKRMTNGEIPLYENGNAAHLDSQVDFSISLRRYAELSGNASFLERSRELIEQTVHNHYSPSGYLTFAGNVKNNYIDPKYNALLLKGFIHHETLGKSLYDNYYSLFKDR